MTQWTFPLPASDRLELMQPDDIWQEVKIWSKLDRYGSQLGQRGVNTDMPADNGPET